MARRGSLGIFLAFSWALGGGCATGADPTGDRGGRGSGPTFGTSGSGGPGGTSGDSSDPDPTSGQSSGLTDGDPGSGGTTTGGGLTGGGAEPVCGNGIVEGEEACDTNVLGGVACADLPAPGGGNFDGGTLSCDSMCQFSTEQCHVCGDGQLAGPEVCDGIDLGPATCESEGFDGGELACNDACDGFYTTQCHACGDGAVEGPEACDGDAGAQTCVGVGFDGGTLACGGDCSFDTAACYTCGDGERTVGETCDCGADPASCTAAQLGGVACTGLAAPANGTYTGGELRCGADCLAFDESACTYCGDGARNGSELCEGSDVGPGSCVAYGYAGGGTLACDGQCQFDLSGCSGERCGGQPPPADPTCPAVCDSCNGNRCEVECRGDAFSDPCQGRTINCPDGWDCVVTCDNACSGLQVNCDDDSVCIVSCAGAWGCEAGVDVRCGDNTCHATCDGYTADLIDVECRNSCDCSPC